MSGLLIVFCGVSQAQSTPLFSQSVSQIKHALISDSLSKETIDDAFKRVKRIRKSGRDIANEASKEVGVYGYLEQYLPKIVTDDLVVATRLYYKNNLPLLKALEKKYQVQPRFLVALWGVNNKLARESYGYDALSILTSLKHSKGDAVALEEIASVIKLNASKQLGDIALTSNWQGTLGLLKMKPSQLLNNAQDHDNDGKVDIWNSQADAFASIAQYLKSNGWNYEQTWGRQVKLPKSYANASLADTAFHPLSEWKKRGLRRFDDRALPSATIPAKLVAPDGSGGRVYLTYQNFELVNQLTNSVYDSIAVGYLANRIKYPAIN